MGLPFCDISGDRVPSGDDIKSIANFFLGEPTAVLAHAVSTRFSRFGQNVLPASFVSGATLLRLFGKVRQICGPPLVRC